MRRKTNITPTPVQSFYPEIYFPAKLIDFNQNWQTRVLEALTPPVPEQPKEPQKIEPAKFECAVLFSPIIFFGVFLYLLTTSFPTVLIAGAIWVIIYISSYLLSVINYPKKLSENKKLFAIYERAKSDYKNSLSARDLEIEALQENLKNVGWRYKKRIEISALLTTPSRRGELIYKNEKMGKSEIFFKKHLIDVFGDAIKTDKIIEIFSYKNYDDQDGFYDYTASKSDNAYVPDFIFEHPISGLTIDIEIDEPFSQGKPIHYHGNLHDRNRNEYFSHHNWLVIRFSEFQIITGALSCCKEIATIIQDLIGDKSYLNTLEQHPRIFRHKKWSSTEARTFKNPLQKNDYFRSNRRNLYTPEANIMGLWFCNGRRYLVDKTEIVENTKGTNGDIVTDQGTFKIEITLDLRYILSVKWQNSNTKYIIESCDASFMLWTDLYSRRYIFFTKAAL